MDCVECHNRPAHVYQPPDLSVDQSFAAGRLDPSLPYLKREAISLLSKTYQTEGEALKAIGSGIDQFYRQNYSELYSSKSGEIKTAVSELQRIFQTYTFPEMKVDWKTHPNNIGHYYFSGCFRCHDGNHESKDGKVIRNNCDICHTVIYDSAAPPEKNAKIGSYQHPVNLGELAKLECTTCHKANGPFKHPLNLGDISEFQCVECHNQSKSYRANERQSISSGSQETIKSTGCDLAALIPKVVSVWTNSLLWFVTSRSLMFVLREIPLECVKSPTASCKTSLHSNNRAR